MFVNRSFGFRFEARGYWTDTEDDDDDFDDRWDWQADGDLYQGEATAAGPDMLDTVRALPAREGAPAGRHAPRGRAPPSPRARPPPPPPPPPAPAACRGASPAPPPPCPRRRSWLSRMPARSRQIASVVTSTRRARSETSTEPLRRART